MTTTEIKESVDKISNILIEIDVLNESLKDLTSDLKEKGYPVANLVAAAKLLVKQKHQDYRAKTDEVNSFIDVCV